MGINIAKTTCDRHAHLAEPLREDDGKIVDLPPTGGPIYADGYQGWDRSEEKVRLEITDTKGDNG